MNKKQSAIKLSVLLQTYLKSNRRIKSSTADMTERVFRYLIDAVGDMVITDIGPVEAELFQAALIDRGLRKRSVNSYTKTASPVFSWAVEKKLVEANPFDGLKKFKITHKRVRVFKPLELERLIRTCPDDRWMAIILLGLTSLRRGEVLNLTVSNIDFEKNIIHIEPKEETAFTWQWEPKDYDRRALPLIPLLSKLLAGLYEKLPNGQPYLLLKPERYGYLLRHQDRLTDRARSCPDNNFNRTFRGICNRAFVSGYFHMLRATALTQLANDKGLGPQEVQELAGHSSIETTRRYLAIRPDVLTRARDIFDRGVAQFG